MFLVYSRRDLKLPLKFTDELPRWFVIGDITAFIGKLWSMSHQSRLMRTGLAFELRPDQLRDVYRLSVDDLLAIRTVDVVCPGAKWLCIENAGR